MLLRRGGNQAETIRQGDGMAAGDRVVDALFETADGSRSSIYRLEVPGWH